MIRPGVRRPCGPTDSLGAGAAEASPGSRSTLAGDPGARDAGPLEDPRLQRRRARAYRSDEFSQLCFHGLIGKKQSLLTPFSPVSLSGFPDCGNFRAIWLVFSRLTGHIETQA